MWRAAKSCRVSNTMTPDFCVDALSEAIARFGAPEILNTDQGSQFTSTAWTDVLKDAGVRISMDGKGRWIDNVFIERLWRSVKYEDIVCYERDCPGMGGSDALSKMRARPLGIGLQEQVSNRRKLRESRALVVNVAGKGGVKLRQVRLRKTNASEPLMTCRNVSMRRRNRDLDVCPANQVGDYLSTAQLTSGMKAA